MLDNSYEQFEKCLPQAIEMLTPVLYKLSQEMGADFKKIGWFGPYDRTSIPDDDMLSSGSVSPSAYIR